MNDCIKCIKRYQCRKNRYSMDWYNVYFNILSKERQNLIIEYIRKNKEKWKITN